MKKMKFALTAAAVMCMCSAAYAQETKLEFEINSPNMKVNGVQTEIDPGYGTAPVISDGRTLLPIRAVVEAMGGSIGWDAETKTASVNKDDIKVDMTIGSKTASVNGSDVALDAAPVIMNGRTMLPLRFVAENFGFKVDWDAETKTVTVTAGEAEQDLTYDNKDALYAERGGTDGRTYAFGMDDLYILDTKKQPVAKYTQTDDMGIVYTDEKGELYMLTVNYEKNTAKLDSKNGGSVELTFRYPDAFNGIADGSDGMEYHGVASDIKMYALKDGKEVKAFDATGENDIVYTDGSGNELAYISGKDGGADDYVMFPGGNTVMLERAIYTMFVGSDGKNYAFINDYLVAMDKNMIVMEEAKKTRFYVMYEDKNGAVYTEQFINSDEVELIFPDESTVRLAYDLESENYTDGDGNIYILEEDNIKLCGKDGKPVKEINVIGTYEDYENAKGEVYTLVYGDDGMTVMMPGNETVKLSEIMG